MSATSRMPVVIAHHQQQPSTVAPATSIAGANSRRVVVENAAHPLSWYPSINNNNAAAVQQIGINISNAPPPAPLKVAFNKSIGGGVLV